MQPIEQFENLSKRTLANRQNALKSTGPKSELGKKRVSMNAFKHGLTGQKMFLQADESIPYFQIASEYICEFKPVGVREEQLAQHIIDANWRLNRCAAMENNLLGAQTVEQDNDELQAADAGTVALVGQCLAWRSDAKAFEALSRHESRIWRFMHKMEELLERLQNKRMRANHGQTTFVLEECRAWKFYNDSLNRHRALLAEQSAAASAEQAAEAAAESAQAQETKTASALALNSMSGAMQSDQYAVLFPEIDAAVIENPPVGFENAVAGGQIGAK